jgi:pimeloyl-ACP methyl ester carboxylesterase
VTVTEPLDHFGGGGSTTTTDAGLSSRGAAAQASDTHVAFAVRRHSGSDPAKGTLLILADGPGQAGIASADATLAGLDASITDGYDVVVMDQRGTGQSDAFDCPNAALAWHSTTAQPDDSDGGKAYIQAAHAFVNACVSESGVDPDTLQFYSTRQSAEDIELFRSWLGADTLTIVGQGYGSLLAQAYAAGHPDHVAALYLDGAIDPTTGGPAGQTERSTALDQTLEAVMQACTSDSACSADVTGGDALSAWTNLATQLAQGPMTYTFTKADGTTEERSFTLADLRLATASSLSQIDDRTQLQRAVAAGSQGDLWWLARLTYARLGQDPETLAPLSNPDFSNAASYAMTCADYTWYANAGSPAQRANRFINDARSRGIFDTQLGATTLTALPCAFWPAQPAGDPRPVPAPDAPFPTVVLGSTLDTLTPYPGSQRVAANRTGPTWLVTATSGPHLTFNNGNACADHVVTQSLVAGKFPKQSSVTCEGTLTAPYASIPNTQAAIASTETLLAAYDAEITHGVDYQTWDRAADLTFGCPFGGTITYSATRNGSSLSLNACAFVKGAQATGTGATVTGTDTVRLRLQFAGAYEGTVTYRRQGTSPPTIRGTLQPAS